MKPLILVVEDEAPLVTLLRYNLEGAGFEVVDAPDGEEALISIAERKPDLILLDWMLPLVSGLEVCRQIRRKPETRDIPIIMLTARGEEEDRIRGLDNGADDYITKPFSPSELLARVRAILRRTRPALSTEILRYDDLTMDIASHRVARGSRQIHLCCAICSSIRAGCSRASSCSTPCGATTSTSSRGPSTCTSAACARRSTAATSRI
jgi:two-component system phosphate regulon response regulator PhoB